MNNQGYESVIALVIATLLLSMNVNWTYAQGSEPSVSLLPTSGEPETEVLIAAEGFPPGATITIRFGGNIVPTTPAEVIAALNGTFSATITIPANAVNGEHEILARDESDNMAKATFTVITTAIAISPTVGTVGTKVNVTGYGFLPEQGITVNMDGSLVSTEETSSDGTFETAFVIPQSTTKGPHVISVNDGINRATANLLIVGDTDVGLFHISTPQLVDQTGNEVSSPRVGMQLLVRSEIENMESVDHEFTYIVQIKDSEGATTMISWMEGTISAEKRYKVAQSWLAEGAGEYMVEVFVWKSISEPLVLAPMQKLKFSVAAST